MPRILTLAVAAIALLAVAACGDDDETPSSTSSDASGSTATAPVSGDGSPTPIPNVCLRNPDPATDEFLIVRQPTFRSAVTSPLIVTGEINYFEATFQIAIYDADGATLAEASGEVQQEEAGVISSFLQGIVFTVAEPTPACLWVYEESAREGSPIHVGQVPLVLLP